MTKLCYDSRCDADALYHLHGITLQGVYDLQVAYTLVHQTPDDPFLKGMLHALRQPGIVESDQLAEVLHRKELCKQEMRVLGSHRMFLRRPVPNYILEYCALDVIFLFNMFALWGGVSRVFILSSTRMYTYVNEATPRAPRLMSLVDFERAPAVCEPEPAAGP